MQLPSNFLKGARLSPADQAAGQVSFYASDILGLQGADRKSGDQVEHMRVVRHLHSLLVLYAEEAFVDVFTGSRSPCK